MSAVTSERPDESSVRLKAVHQRRKSWVAVDAAESVIDVPPPAAMPTAEYSLRDLWYLLLKHRRVVLLATVGVFALTLLVTLLMTPIYRSTVLLHIESSGLKITKSEGIEGVVKSDDFMGTQVEVLKSRSVAQRAVRKLGLLTDADFQRSQTPTGGFAAFKAWVLGGPAVAQKSIDEREAELVVGLLKATKVEPIRRSELVALSYENPDPQVAARVVMGLAQAYMDGNMARREENARVAGTFLEDRLQQIKQKLEDSERSVLDYAQSQHLASVDQNTLLASSNLQQLNTILSQASADRIKAETRWREAVAANGVASLETLKSPLLDRLSEMRVQLRSEYESKRATYKPDYPEMVQLAHRIAEVEARMREEITAYTQGAEVEYKSALGNELSLRKRVGQLQDELLDLQGRSVQFNILKRESDTNKQLYDALLQRYKEIGIGGEIAANNVSVIDSGRKGERVKPSLPNNLALGLLLGLSFGVALALLKEILDDTLKSPEDIERHLGLHVYGVIPFLEHGLVESVMHDPRSSFSEAYRSLRTGLQYATQDGAPRILLVSSAVAGEGKSITSVTLALQFAQLGRKVLLIDADLRKPSMHTYLGLENKLGLSDYLTGRAPGVEIFQGTRDAHLTAVTAGGRVDQPAEVLASARFESMLQVALHTYDQIIIDGPPLLGLADAPTLAQLADGTLFVVGAGQARVATIVGAIQRLAAARARPIGAVLVRYDARRANVQSQAAGDGHAYGYGYGYGHSYAVGHTYGQDGAQGIAPARRRWPWRRPSSS